MALGVPSRTQRRFSRWLPVVSLLLVVTGEVSGASVPEALEIYDETTAIVTAKFYDRTFRGLPWEKMVATAREELDATSDDKKLAETINDLLGSLDASHTKFLSASDQEYWVLNAVFSREIEGAPLAQIGAWFVAIDGMWFIKNIVAASPAAKAGLLAGDEVVSANGRPFEPVRSFAGSAGRPVQLSYRRSRNGPERLVAVTPEVRGFQSSFLAATVASRAIFPLGKKRIGYFHLWAGTHPRFQEALAKAVEDFRTGTDAMILDLRDGFGGCAPAWLNPFFDHDEEGRPISQLYAKPLAILINGGTRSGKEWLAHILKQKKRGALMGSRTAGSFLAGQPFEIRPGRCLLFLAVSGNGPAGVDLEQKGVAPDISVAFELPYSAGKDPQLDAALEKLAAD